MSLAHRGLIKPGRRLRISDRSCVNIIVRLDNYSGVCLDGRTADINDLERFQTAGKFPVRRRGIMTSARARTRAISSKMDATLREENASIQNDREKSGFSLKAFFSGRHVFGGLAAVLLLAAGATTVLAQGDPIAERKALLKQMGAALREPGQMMKGDAPFDLAKVKEALAQVAVNSAKLGDLFPDNSKTGDTGALPTIWEDKADFTGRFDKLNKAAAAALVSITDLASLRATMPKVLGNCGGCHKIYRKPT